MNQYITETMARIGCSNSDTEQIIDICNELTRLEWDTLDAINAFGLDMQLTEQAETAKASLVQEHGADSVQCLAAYVGAYRNVAAAYPSNNRTKTNA